MFQPLSRTLSVFFVSFASIIVHADPLSSSDFEGSWNESLDTDFVQTSASGTHVLAPAVDPGASGTYVLLPRPYDPEASGTYVLPQGFDPAASGTYVLPTEQEPHDTEVLPVDPSSSGTYVLQSRERRGARAWIESQDSPRDTREVIVRAYKQMVIALRDDYQSKIDRQDISMDVVTEYYAVLDQTQKQFRQFEARLPALMLDIEREIQTDMTYFRYETSTPGRLRMLIADSGTMAARHLEKNNERGFERHMVKGLVLQKLLWESTDHDSTGEGSWRQSDGMLLVNAFQKVVASKTYEILGRLVAASCIPHFKR